MDLNKVYSLHALCLSEMPAKYPKPRLVIHESPEALVAFLGDAHYAFQHVNQFPASLVQGMADVERNTVHLPYVTVAAEGEVVLLDVLLHEIGHLFYGVKFGKDSPQYLDENKANAFARRWKPKIKAKWEAAG